MTTVTPPSRWVLFKARVRNFLRALGNLAAIGCGLIILVGCAGLVFLVTRPDSGISLEVGIDGYHTGWPTPTKFVSIEPSATPSPTMLPSPTAYSTSDVATAVAATFAAHTQQAETRQAPTAEPTLDPPSHDEFMAAVETRRNCIGVNSAECNAAWEVIQRREAYSPLSQTEWLWLTPTAMPTQVPPSPSATMRPTSTLQASGFIVVTSTPIDGWIVVATGEPTPQG